jgi:hypothetical protein
MKIIIKDEEIELEISDEQLDNDSFVNLSIKGNLAGDISMITVPLRELFSAVIAFDSMRSKRLSEEEYMD